MIHTFARVSAAVTMNVKDVYRKTKQLGANRLDRQRAWAMVKRDFPTGSRHSQSEPSRRLALARLTGSAGFLAGPSPVRLDAASAASGLVAGRVRGRPSSGA